MGLCPDGPGECGGSSCPRVPGQQGRPPWQQPARPHPARQSWSSSQWDAAGKDKRKDSKNKIKPAQCPIPLKTEAESGTRPSATLGAEAVVAGPRENLMMQLVLAFT